MSESYKGLTLNQYQDDDPEPNRPGQRENTNFKAIINAITTDSLNPTDIAAAQGKVAIYSPNGNAISRVISVPIPINSLVTILSASPINPEADYTGIDGFMQITAIDHSAAYQATGYFQFMLATICGVVQVVSQPFDPTSGAWVSYDSGAGSNAFCIVGNYGTAGSPATLECINRQPSYSNAEVMAILTYKVVDIDS